jgi:cell division protein ZapA
MPKHSQDRSVSVEIYDGVYQLRGVDPLHISRLAAMVDGKMRAVSAHGATVDSLRVAVLAALNIADELTELRQRHHSLLASLDDAETHNRRRATSLSDLLDGALEEDYRDRIAV